jgi:hypothetical protein
VLVVVVNQRQLIKKFDYYPSGSLETKQRWIENFPWVISVFASLCLWAADCLLFVCQLAKWPTVHGSWQLAARSHCKQ